MRFKIHFTGCCLLGLLLLGETTSVLAQVPPRTTQPNPGSGTSDGAIRGRVMLPGGGFVTEAVRISLQTIRGTDATVFTDNTGRFEFTRLTPGRYQIVVDADPQRFQSTTESVELIRGSAAVVTVYLKDKDRPGQLKASTVSATELDSRVPAKARKEFQQAGDAFRNGNTEESLNHLRKAIEIYPRYLMAHNDLGAQLLDLNRLEEAEKELRAALDIDPAAFNPTLNLGIVSLKNHQIPQAIEFFEKAVSMQSQSPAARLFYGVALMNGSESDRAEKEFLAAYNLGGAQYAEALFHLGQLYMNRGDRVLARQYFERYIRDAPKASNLGEVRKLIAKLD
jgi:Flp pilus assembly protein TadD